ncbi:hypothetical protein [Myxococcus stipitatus]|uniref:hypothetical protein n=1 Tax=Myxococcus stipitatus TaxID=83455 RepID=UPI0030D29A38
MKTPLPLALAALLVCVGCAAGSPDAPCASLDAVPTKSVRSTGPLVFPVNALVEVDVAVTELFQACGSTEPPQHPDTATAQVFDPDGLPIPAEVSLDGAKSSALLSFTPTTVGRYHAIIAFTPVGGIQQFGLYVASPWTGASTAVTLPLPRCAQLDRTSRGLWLCDGVALRDSAAAPLRLGSATSPPDVAVSGNVVWVLGDGRVRRYVDTGTELELTGSLLLSTTEGVQTLQARLASENELVVMDNQSLHRFVFTDAGVLLAPPSTLWTTTGMRTFAVDAAVGLLVRASPDQVLTVSLREATDSEACPFSLQSNGSFARTSAPCTPLRGRPVGLEEGVVWTQSEPRAPGSPSAMLRRWEISQGKLVEQSSLILDGLLSVTSVPVRAGFTVPTLSPGLWMPVPVRSPLGPATLRLEVMPPGLPLTEGSRLTSPRFYWGGDSRPTTGSTTVYQRAPASP